MTLNLKYGEEIILRCNRDTKATKRTLYNVGNGEIKINVNCKIPDGYSEQPQTIAQAIWNMDFFALPDIRHQQTNTVDILPTVILPNGQKNKYRQHANQIRSREREDARISYAQQFGLGDEAKMLSEWDRIYDLHRQSTPKRKEKLKRELDILRNRIHSSLIGKNFDFTPGETKKNNGGVKKKKRKSIRKTKKKKRKTKKKKGKSKRRRKRKTIKKK